MSDELDRRAALAMGWTYVKAKDGLDDWYDDGNDGIVFVNRWSPSTDRNDLAELLCEVERRGLGSELSNKISYMWIEKTVSKEVLEIPYTIWVMTSYPAVICKAACEVLEAR